jgi:hypothetical protein
MKRLKKLKEIKREVLHRAEKLKEIKKRAIEVFSPPMLILFGFMIRIFSSFVSWIRAIFLTWGVLDGFSSSYLYKEEKLFPYQFLRYCRIIANISGIVNPVIPIFWNIGDGIYSFYLYRDATTLEHLPRFGRILNGALQAILI